LPDPIVCSRCGASARAQPTVAQGMGVRIKGQSRFRLCRCVQHRVHFQQLIAPEGNQPHALTRLAP
jgi:hypothetical protein